MTTMNLTNTYTNNINFPTMTPTLTTNTPTYTSYTTNTKTILTTKAASNFLFQIITNK